MISSSKRSGRLHAILVAVLIIGLLIGAGGAYLFLKTQLVELASQLEKAKAPSLPPLASVSLDTRSTVLLLLDFTPAICYRRASCNATLLNAQALLAKARSAGIPITYTRSPVVELSNRTGEVVIANDKGADKFYNTELDAWLRDKGSKTVVIAGIAANGAVLYSSFEAALRGYTVVVAADSVVSDSEFIQNYTLFQLLNQPGRSNPENKPLAPSAVTLSSVSLIRFKP
jgi:nicotinamidase-related amidase